MADEAPFRMGELFQQTQLIVHGKIHSHTSNTVTLRVLDVWYNYRTGIENGDYLRVENDFNIVCPIEIPLEYADAKREGVFFLNYSGGSWHLTMGEVAFIQDGKAQISFTEEGYEYSANIDEWKKDLQDYYHHFPRTAENSISPKLDSSSWSTNDHLTPLVKLQYHSYYRAFHVDLSDTPRLHLFPMEFIKVEEND